MNLHESALEHFGHTVGLMPEHFLAYRVLGDDQADEVASERHALDQLKLVLDWRSSDDDPDDAEFATLPGKLMARLRETVAYELASSWLQVRCVEVVLNEIAGEFGGSDPLKPDPRSKLEETKQSLLSLRDELLALLNIDVILPEPGEEELQELREMVQSVQTG